MSYESTVLADSPVIYLRLGESSGTVADDISGNEYDGAYVANPTLGEVGIPGSGGNTAVLFNGSTQYAEVVTGETVTGVPPYTVECWYIGTAVGTNVGGGTVGPKAFISASIETFKKRYVIGLDANGKVRFYTGNSYDLTGPTTAAVNDGADYHHIVCTKSADGVAQVYIDGVLDVTRSGITHPGVGSAPFRIALNSRVSGGLGYLAGTIDEVAYYDYVLTSTQISTHHAAGVLELVDGTASSAATFTALAAGQESGETSALGVILFTGTASATVTRFGTASSAITFTGIASEAPAVTGTAISSITFTAQINLLLPIFVKRAVLLPSDYTAEMIP